MPERIRWSRFDGQPLPAGAKLVTRPGRWGNPFRIGQPAPEVHGIEPGVHVADRETAVALYRQWLRANPPLVQWAREELAGYNLACACPLPAPGREDICHAAVLLHVAQGGDP
jgi:hypothetical protein